MSVVYQCGDISPKVSSDEHRKALLARKQQALAANKVAVLESGKVFTQRGDFCHLAPTGMLTQSIR